MKSKKESTEENIPINSSTKKTFLEIFAVLLACTLLLNIFSAYWIFQMKDDLNKEMTVIAQSLVKIENNTFPKPQAGELITVFENTNLTLTTWFYSRNFNVSLYRKAYIYYKWIGGNLRTQWGAWFIASDIWGEQNTFFVEDSPPQRGVLVLEIAGPRLYIELMGFESGPSDPQWLIVSLSIYLTY